MKAFVVFGSWGLYEFCNFFYDVVLWAYVQEKYEVLGSAWLIVGAGIMNITFLYMYLHGKMDLFGFGTIEETRVKYSLWSERNMNSCGVKKLASVVVKWFSQKNDVVTFFVLSICTDSFVTTAYLRHGNFSSKIEKKDWLIFISSTLLSGIAWGGIIEVFLVVAKTALRIFTNL
ncbi:MAG: hypothetical protein WC827_04905 [Candidatus Paceibacterota bacterium]|jgi:hypothetical protein